LDTGFERKVFDVRENQALNRPLEVFQNLCVVEP
jgi:hypothetical protein